MYLIRRYHIHVYIACACACLLTTTIESDTPEEGFGNLEGTLLDSEITKLGNQFDTQSNNNRSVRVELTYGTFIGAQFTGYDRFVGIPYAEPPVGDLRLRNPIPPKGYYHDLNVQLRSPSCVQQASSAGSGYWATLLTTTVAKIRSVPLFVPLVEGVEDCLTLDVYRPSNLPKDAKVPVMFFIYGGAFVMGGGSLFPGKELVLKSRKIQKPIIYVIANYRLNAFGFLGGKEVFEAGVANLGLKDQRLALQWVQDHIHRFGGDPRRVTVFGQSAGAMSISYHLIINRGNLNGLFRAAICESGTALPTQHLPRGGQEAYDLISRELGCSSRNDSLACIREADTLALIDAQNLIEGFLSLNYMPPSFQPYIDGEFITEPPRDAFDNGRFAKVPIISGDQDDEGTVIGFGQISLITTRRLGKYLKKLMNNATKTQLETVMRLYPEDITKGSPFDTGYDNAMTPVFKRYSAIVGDFLFHSLRRRFSRIAQSQVPLWGYIDKGYKRTPMLGSFHLSELLAVFGFVKSSRSHDFQTRWIHFAYNLNPNAHGLAHWSRYGKGKGKLMRFGPHGSEKMVRDEFREEAIGFLAKNEGYLVV